MKINGENYDSVYFNTYVVRHKMERQKFLDQMVAGIVPI